MMATASSLAQINRFREESLKSTSLSFIRNTLVVTIMVTICLSGIANLTIIDIGISAFFANDIDGFPLTHHWLTQTVLHLYAARLAALAGLALIGFNLWQWICPSVNNKIAVAARYLMISWVSSVLTIALLKQVTTLPCPWNLKQFGGTVDYIFIYELFSGIHSAGKCFPAAHASSGYGLIGCGFVALMFGRHIGKGFLLPLLIGLVYGGAQIVRGAHFISHDLFTLGICLSLSWFWAEVYLFRSKAFLNEDTFWGTNRQELINSDHNS